MKNQSRLLKKVCGFKCSASALMLVMCSLFAITAKAKSAIETTWTGATGGSEEAPIDLYSTSWSSGVLPTSAYDLIITVGELTYVKGENPDSTKWLCNIFKPKGDYVWIGPLFASTVNPGNSSIVKKGDWRLDYDLYFPGGASCVAALTNETGSLSVARDFYIASGTGSTARFVWKDGNLAGPKADSNERYTFRIAHGQNSTGIVEKVAGDWIFTNSVAVAMNSGTKAEFYHKGGSFATLKYFMIGNSDSATYDAYMEVSGGSVSNLVNAVNIGQKGKAGSKAVLKVTDGNVYANTHVQLGVAGAGTLTIDGTGLVEAPNGSLVFSADSSDSTEGSTLNLDGGTLYVRNVKYGKGSGKGTFIFNGGTLKAASGNTEAYLLQNTASISYLVGDNGGTIDTSEAEVAIPASIANASGATSGGLTVMGGNAAVFTGVLTYSGSTTVELGTSVSVASKPAGGFAVVAPETAPTGFTYSRIELTGDGTFSESDLPGSIPSGWTAGIVSSGKAMAFVYGAPDGAVWVGGASGSLSEGSNWLAGAVPANGSAVTISAPAAATLTCDGEFSPSSITFPSGSALVTIEGEGRITGIQAITNLASGCNHVFNVPVEGDTIDFYQTPWMYFNGGITVEEPTFTPSGNSDKYLQGHWRITGETWSPISGNKVGNGNTVFVEGALTNPNNISIYAGAIVTTATVNVTSSSYLAYTLNGTLVVTGLVNNASSSTLKLGREDGHGTVLMDGYVQNTGEWPNLNATTLAVGKDGFSFAGDSGIIRFNNAVTVYALDETLPFAGKSSGNAYTAYGSATVKFNTSRYGSSPEEGASFLINAPFYEYSSGTYAMLASGVGTVRFNVSSSGFTQGITATNSVTLALAAGVQPGGGAVTLKDASTLKVVESGTATVKGTLTLEAGTTLAFNFTQARTAPTLAVGSLALPESGTVSVRISADCSQVSGSMGHILLSGGSLTADDLATFTLEDKPKWVDSLAIEDGNLVLRAIPNGFMIIFY